MIARRFLVACVGLMLVAGLFASARAQSGAPAATGSQFAIRFDSGGNASQAPVTFVGNVPFVPVKVNGAAPSLFQLDSAAAHSEIGKARAVALGLLSGAQTAAATNSGSADPPLTIPNATLALPGVTISITALPVTEAAHFSAETGQEFDGALGRDMLASAVVALNYETDSVQVLDPPSFHYAGQGFSLPLTFAGGVPLVRARFSVMNGKSAEGEFALDTALDASLVVTHDLTEHRHVLGSHTKTISTIDPELGLTAAVTVARLNEFQLGPKMIENIVAEFPQQDWNPASGQAGVAGAIGGGLLRRFTVIFDLQHQRAYFEPNRNYGSYDQEDKSGLAVVAAGDNLKTFQVADVAPGSLAAKAGIQKGDIIDGVDDEAAADMSLAVVRDELRQPFYNRKLTMERAGKPYEVTLSLQPIL